ncbi:MAG TPA: hypothetical protein VGB00_00490 [Pyrinomonadaceae bacterium]|jgi:hypothetical protein
MFDIRLEQAKRGMMGREMQEAILAEASTPFWVSFLYWFDWLIALILFILNWKITLIVWIIRFILKVIPVLETFGNIFMRPFRPKLPEGVLSEHIAIANTIKSWHDTPTEDKQWDKRYNRMLEMLKELGFKDNDEKAILKALDILGADEWTKSSASDLYREEKSSFLRERKLKENQKQWRINSEDEEPQQEDWREREYQRIISEQKDS